MNLVTHSGAYIRKPAIDRQILAAAGVRRDTLEHRVWELLETPQTTLSLLRAVGRVGPNLREDIEDVIDRLLDAEVIELSPDS